MTLGSRQTTLALAFATLLTAGAVSVPAHAASDGGSTVATPTCKKAMVWDKKKRKCVKVKKSSSLSDDNIYEGARDLAYNGRYGETLELLALAADQSDPRILNYRGFATRKLGRVDEALGYYRAALKADPDYTLVMSYMGEAFLQQGRVGEARKQLAAIEKQCGIACREYALLDGAISAYVAN